MTRYNALVGRLGTKMPVFAVNQLQRYLSDFSGLYPGIQTWAEKVVDELQFGRRSLIIATVQNSLAGLVITKNGTNAKLCHISVAKEFWGHQIGTMLMRSSIEEMLRSGAREVHATMSDDGVNNFGDFFARSGFRLVETQRDRYREGLAELVWRASKAQCTTYLDEVGSGPLPSTRKPTSRIVSATIPPSPSRICAGAWGVDRSQTK